MLNHESVIIKDAPTCADAMSLSHWPMSLLNMHVSCLNVSLPVVSHGCQNVTRLNMAAERPSFYIVDAVIPQIIICKYSKRTE